MKNLLSLLKKKIQDPLFVFGVLFVLGIICFVLSPTFKDSTQPIGAIGVIGYVCWGLIPILFFGGKYIFSIFKKK